jgi:hypothetical protein
MSLHLRPLDLATLDAIAVDSYAIFVAEDERPLWGLGGLLDWRLSAGLSRFLKAQVVVGERDEAFLTPIKGLLPGSRIFAFGLGPLAQVTAERFAGIAERSLSALAKAGVESVAIGLPERPPLSAAARSLRLAMGPLGSAEAYLLGPVSELEKTLLGTAAAR